MKTLLTLALGLAVLAPLSAESLNPFVNNPSFENSGTSTGGWYLYISPGASGSFGSWFPATDLPNSGLKAYDGKTVGFVRTNDSPNSQSEFVSLAQEINSVTFTPGQTYSLTYAIARRADVSTPAEFQLRIGSTSQLTSNPCVGCYNDFYGSTGNITPGQWQLFTVSYTAQAPDAGQHPIIYLADDGAYLRGQGPTEIEFDIAPIPEPGTVVLFAGGLIFMFFFISRRRAGAKA